MNKFLSSLVKGHKSKVKGSSGFTLLELLIVISIIAILSVALVVILDPSEALKKARDAQRISDMNTMKTAIGLYVTSTSTPYLGSATSTQNCKANIPAATTRVFYSLPTPNGVISAINLDGGAGVPLQVATVASSSLTDGTGWIPVNFDSLTGGSPISNLPLDPVNTISTLSAPTSANYVYRYACSISPLTFEIDAALESTAYTSVDNKRATDGGNNTNFYEVGTNLRILGAGNDF